MGELTEMPPPDEMKARIDFLDYLAALNVDATRAFLKRCELKASEIIYVEKTMAEKMRAGS
jgi:hypothetical protein